MEAPLYRWDVATLRSKDPLDRCKALLKILEKTTKNRETAFRRVRRLLKDTKSQVRGLALQTLAVLGDGSVAETLLNIVEQGEGFKYWGKVDRKAYMEWAEWNLLRLLENHGAEIPRSIVERLTSPADNGYSFEKVRITARARLNCPEVLDALVSQRSRETRTVVKKLMRRRRLIRRRFLEKP